MVISFRKVVNQDSDFKLLHKWCNKKFVYEWFEQRTLSYDEINRSINNNGIIVYQQLSF